MMCVYVVEFRDDAGRPQRVYVEDFSQAHHIRNRLANAGMGDARVRSAFLGFMDEPTECVVSCGDGSWMHFDSDAKADRYCELESSDCPGPFQMFVARYVGQWLDGEWESAN